MTLNEQALNHALAELLDDMRRRWQVSSETLRSIERSAQRPDILITEPGARTLVIEHEKPPALNVEPEARQRLGLRLTTGKTLLAAIALRSPAELADGPGGPDLRERMMACESFEYALFRGAPDSAARWPRAGWLRGSVHELALLAQQAMRPVEEIDTLADILETQIERAAGIFSRAWPADHPGVHALLAEHLKLEDGPQSRRMAMAMLANALIFQQSLAPQLDDIEPPSQLYRRSLLRQDEVWRQWRAILEINYYPIFHVAAEILDWMDRPRVAADILHTLHHVNLQIELSDSARSHDLTGFVFQRLIADRKFLATFYTRPESAALLAALALPLRRPLAGAHWNDPHSLRALKIGDFACGTGTLLSAVYQRLGALHELHGGDAAALHQAMLEQALVGCDVLPMAVHLTLSMLASAVPEQTFRDCHMLVMPYGRQERVLGHPGEFDYALGSLDLLDSQTAIPTMPTRPDMVAAIGGGKAAEQKHDIKHGSFALVIMNPPFTRPTNHEGEHKNIPNPAFAAFGADIETQNALGALSKELTHGTVAHGNAGMASYFFALANRKVRDGGTVAQVLPLVALSGAAWEKVRQLLKDSYEGIIVATIAGAKSRDSSFSADTSIGECLLVANKHSRKAGEANRGRFLTLQERPRNEMDGEQIGRAVHAVGQVRRLEDGPFGGTPLQVGADEIGQILDFPLPERGPWQLSGILDFALAQSAWQISRGMLWLPGTPAGKEIPVTKLAFLGNIGPISRDINGMEGGTPRGPFDIHKPPLHAAPTYPALWAHHAPRERCMELEPDSEAIVRTSHSRNLQEQINKKAARIWATATRSHIATDFRYNSQALCVSSTTVDCIGGRAWPSVIFPRAKRASWEPAFALWSNSTLGILMHWWQASRQQSGRGSISQSAQPALPTLDLRALSDHQLNAAARIFSDLRRQPMLPVNQLDEDPVRAQLDSRLLTEVLALPAALSAPDGPLALLRRKLAAEPSIHGGKKSRVRLPRP